MNVEGGMWKAEKEMVVCLILKSSAFRIPTSEFPKPYAIRSIALSELE